MRVDCASVGATALLLAAVACSGDRTALGPVVTGPPMVDPTIPTAVAGSALTQQLAVMGSTITPGPSVTVYAGNSRVMSGTRVTFEVTEGGGSVDPAETVTSAYGIAGVTSWKLGPNPGANTIVARVGSLSATFTVFGINPAETPIASYRLTKVGNGPTPYSSGYNDLGAVVGLEGSIDLFSNYFIRTFKFMWRYGNSTPVFAHAQGPYTRGADGTVQFGYIDVSAMLRGDSLYVAPEKLPDDLTLATFYLKQ